MKKSSLILCVFILSIISGCAKVDLKKSPQTSAKIEEKENSDEKAEVVKTENAETDSDIKEEDITKAQPILNTPKELYTISGKHRDKEKYLIKDDFKFVFPAGKITRIFGSSLGVREKQLTMSKQELEELISVFEQDAIAYPDATYTFDEVERQKSEQLMPKSKRDETYGQVILEIETESNNKHVLCLSVHADNMIGGVSYPGLEEGGNVSFGVESPKIAEKLRSLIDFKVIDRSVLDQAVSAKCTSMFNGNSVTLTGEQLKEFVTGLQMSENVMPAGTILWEYESAVTTLEILLENGEIVRGLFRGHGYHGLVGIEAELLQTSVKSARYLENLFEENDIPQSPPYYFISEQCKYVDPPNYSVIDPPERDEKYFLSYAEAASYPSIIRLGGEQREDEKIVWNKKQKNITLPEGMVINTTTNQANGEKVAAIPTEDEVHKFIEILESAPAEKLYPDVWTDELNMVILDTSGKYNLLLFSLDDSYFNYENEKWVNCMILSENKKNHGRSFRITSEELYNMVSKYVKTPE